MDSKARRRQRYIELDEESIAELQEAPTLSLTWSFNSGSNSGHSSVATNEDRAKKSKDTPTGRAKFRFIYKRLRAAFRSIRFRQRNKHDDGPTRIGISESPKNYLVTTKEHASKRTSHKEGKLLHQSRVLKRRLKLLTITEDEEFDTGLHEC